LRGFFLRVDGMLAAAAAMWAALAFLGEFVR
jgi:hypothetical protein